MNDRRILKNGRIKHNITDSTIYSNEFKVKYWLIKMMNLHEKLLTNLLNRWKMFNYYDYQIFSVSVFYSFSTLPNLMKRGPDKIPIERGRTVPNARLMSKLLLLDFLPTTFGEGVL